MTLDAMGCQRAIAERILARGGDYLLTLKANHPIAQVAVARILGDGTRQRTRAFAELQSHYLFLDRFGRPGKGNDKGKVEGLVGYARRNFLVPVPVMPRPISAKRWQ